MTESTLAEIADDIATARSALSDALHLAQQIAMEGGDTDGWLGILQDAYGIAYTLEAKVQEQIA